MTTNIYILKLEGGNYYVGKTDHPMKRYQEHLNGAGSAWTKNYKPIGVEKIIENASPFDEDRYVKEYMAKYGMDKVRGGAYILEELPKFQEEALNLELRAVKDYCTSCGRKGHWAKDCYAKTELYENSKPEKAPVKKNEPAKKIPVHSPPQKFSFNSCERCGRKGHFEPECYASTDKYGCELDSDEYSELDDSDSDDSSDFWESDEDS